VTAPLVSTAPGHPGIEPRWTSSVKCGVGTAIGAQSRVWFTISHGILNEIYYPRVDQANTRDLGLLVTDGSTFFSEEKRHTISTAALLASGVPGYRLTNTCRNGRYRIIKTIVTDPDRDVLLQDIRFEPMRGSYADYRVYVLLAPHLGNQGYGNDGWVGDYKGVPMLFAQRGARALALASSAGFAALSCGYVGISDGWQDINANRRLVHCYSCALDGNIALTGEVDLPSCDGHFVLSLAFGPTAAEAGLDARAGLMQDFDAVCGTFVRGWTQFQRKSLDLGDQDAATIDEDRLGVAVLKTHEDKGHPGGLIASLAIPWGSHKGDHDLGGYHVVWPRDLVESAGALLAAGHADGARDALHYLMCTQDADGHWPQNMWLDGAPFWTGTQLDETGFPILLADHLRRRKALGALRPWPMVRLAASYLVKNGPLTPEDRWEEDGGYSPFTLAVEIAALLAAADFADEEHEANAARYLRETADAWSDSIERWTYATNTPLAHTAGVDGYYVRIAPPTMTASGVPGSNLVSIKNHPRANCTLPADALVSPDALALVRFGLRSAADPHITNTVRVIDRVLRRETSRGPVWHRYNEDGYGEHEDGAAFDGAGIGRGWPLLAGERAHYELAAGRADEAKRLLDVMRAQSNSGLIPEQVWDEADIPALELFNGCPSGSAMPLAWAHAEYVKLVRSLRDGRVFDMPPQTVKRYIRTKHPCARVAWRFNHKLRTAPAGRDLRIEASAPMTVHWTDDSWHTVNDVAAADSTIGMWYADLEVGRLTAGSQVQFTFYWLEEGRWEGEDFAISMTAS
jgi:glucoamylase